MTTCAARPTACSSRRSCNRSSAPRSSFSGARLRLSGSRSTSGTTRWSLRWYDYAACVVYISYFLATYVVAGFLWFFARDLFRRFVATVSLLAMMGFATYALFPAAPPWFASERGKLEPTTRLIGFIWSHIPIAHFDALFEKGAEYANPVAAVPSLHGAYTLLITLFLWRLVPRWSRVLLAAYPCAMTFALVYQAQSTTSSTSCSASSTR